MIDSQGPVRRIGCLGLLALLGCGKPAPPVIGDLAFPVVVLFEASGPVVHTDADDLSTMSTQRVVMADSPPYLIDSRLDVYRLRSLRSTHGGAWLMLHPNGRTEVTFELERLARADVREARRLIARLGRLPADPAEREQRLLELERSTTLRDLLDSSGSSRPGPAGD